MGKRKALIIGINYIGTPNALAGCIYDAENILKLLRGLYGDTFEVHFLKETDKNRANHPTRANILREIDWLVSGNTAGDSLFIHYSGHGGSIPDDDHNEEADRKDETIFPLDGHIRDDDLRARLIDKVQPGVKLMCLFDCCHSGTILDLKYGYKQPQTGKLQDFTNNVPETKTDVVLFSGCKDNQYSWEVYDERQIQGAMTNSLVKAFAILSKSSTKRGPSKKTPNPARAKVGATIRNLQRQIATQSKIIRKNKSNPRLVAICKRKIMKIKESLQSYQKKQKAIPPFLISKGRAITVPASKPTYATLMRTLLSLLQKGGNRQDPQISSGKVLDLNSEFSFF